MAEALPADCGRILEIEGFPSMKCEQAFELSDASAERSAAGCTSSSARRPSHLRDHGQWASGLAGRSQRPHEERVYHLPSLLSGHGAGLSAGDGTLSA